ncbi:MAG: hypothetical protein EBT15_05540 [Betaproteobacteria bacterium]|nr:hypothetical protein [Betaproteobacteria bacterium]
MSKKLSKSEVSLKVVPGDLEPLNELKAEIQKLNDDRIFLRQVCEFHQDQIDQTLVFEELLSQIKSEKRSTKQLQEDLAITLSQLVRVRRVNSLNSSRADCLEEGIIQVAKKLGLLKKTGRPIQEKNRNLVFTAVVNLYQRGQKKRPSEESVFEEARALGCTYSEETMKKERRKYLKVAKYIESDHFNFG